MCGIAGILSPGPLPQLERGLRVMNDLLAHRGPDGEGIWTHPSGRLGLAHRRLSIIDLEGGAQPMKDGHGNVLTYNGEIYNYLELRQELGQENFRTSCDTEVILVGYRRWGEAVVDKLRGMFSFALWDEANQRLFCARDRFGIKPFYYAEQEGVFTFASEPKALLPFLPEVATDHEGLMDYLVFQFCLAGKTLFRHVRELEAGHVLVRDAQGTRTRRYWEVYYGVDLEHTDLYFERRLNDLVHESIELHLRSDVPLGAYLSGGLDSSLVASLAAERSRPFVGFHGRFDLGPEYDESAYARLVSDRHHFELVSVDITVDDFLADIEKVIYHLDYPVAGPGSFSQFVVSREAARHRKVVLGGQGGDELFGGYTRYLIAYFEQCIKAAIDGTMHNGNFVVTYESIIPNLTALRNYKPLLQSFWSEGLFESMDRRYFRLVDRAQNLRDEIRWDQLPEYSPFEVFSSIFYGPNVRRDSYFDLMTNFDFKTLLPALLHVEDRVSMAHGLESRVPLLDHPMVELAATMPASVKFRDGTLKHVFRNAMGGYVPKEIAERQDKMGFPTPVAEWFQGPARDFVRDLLSRERDYVDHHQVLAGLDAEPRFGRKLWGLVCLELWQRRFHDRAAEFRRLLV
ncbi:MAG: asparagine synthase (glutamine-hydrolyzing) [Candidatus Eremiobacteraeota bacterium]|nr:asparagine synthase (glutamine-hydrolyzing) [Candidatus Eremiobacteraeota bacterium]